MLCPGTGFKEFFLIQVSLFYGYPVFDGRYSPSWGCFFIGGGVGPQISRSWSLLRRQVWYLRNARLDLWFCNVAAAVAIIPITDGSSWCRDTT